ncbi:hypothetical protein STEG23_000314 [Scotinomys teguina]
MARKAGQGQEGAESGVTRQGESQAHYEEKKMWELPLPWPLRMKPVGVNSTLLKLFDGVTDFTDSLFSESKETSDDHGTVFYHMMRKRIRFPKALEKLREAKLETEKIQFEQEASVGNKLLRDSQSDQPPPASELREGKQENKTASLLSVMAKPLIPARG